MKRQEKGITLIALVITIIVMLILVAVTINVATSGGLFDSARKAANDTTVESEKETLTQEALGYYDAQAGKIKAQALTAAIKKLEGYSAEQEGDTVNVSKEGRKYIINKNGNVEGPITTSTEGPETVTYAKFISGQSIGKKVKINNNIKELENITQYADSKGGFPQLEIEALDGTMFEINLQKIGDTGYYFNAQQYKPGDLEDVQIGSYVYTFKAESNSTSVDGETIATRSKGWYKIINGAPVLIEESTLPTFENYKYPDTNTVEDTTKINKIFEDLFVIIEE